MGMKKGAKAANYGPKSLGLSCLQTDMLLMFEKDIWGGITQAVKRYAKANNKYMREQYNDKEASIYIFSIWMQTTFRDGQWSKTCQHMDFNGRKQETLHLKK